MRSLSPNFDKMAIGLSLACTLHCLLLPIALVILPALAATTLGDEHFHRWMLAAVVPLSLLALCLGCRQHRRYTVAVMGVLGPAILCATVTLGHQFLGEAQEKTGSVIGATLTALSHYRNQQLCRQQACRCGQTNT